MAKRIPCLVVLFVLINLNGPCDVIAGNKPEPHFSVFWDFYSSNDIGTRVWGMGGAGVANVNELTSMVINPAAFKFDGRFRAYFEVVNKSKNRWMEELSGTNYYLKSRAIIPSFIGFGYNAAGPLYVGLGYSYPRYYKLDLSGMPLPWPIDPSSEEKIYPYDIFKREQLVLPVNLQIWPGFFLGVNLNYNRLSLDMRDYYTIDRRNPNQMISLMRTSDVSFLSFKLGTLVEFSPTGDFLKGSKISLGMAYTPQEGFRPNVEWNKGDLYLGEDKFGETILPRRLELGIKISNLKFPLNFAGDIKFQDNSEVEDLVDRWDIHLGCEWEASRNVALQLGYFNRLDYRDPETGWLDEVGEYDQHFLTAGVRISLSDYLLQFSMRDSHLLSSGLIETTQISVGTGLGF
jgi:hypothetical protein